MFEKMCPMLFHKFDGPSNTKKSIIPQQSKKTTKMTTNGSKMGAKWEKKGNTTAKRQQKKKNIRKKHTKSHKSHNKQPKTVSTPAATPKSENTNDTQQEPTLTRPKHRYLGQKPVETRPKMFKRKKYYFFMISSQSGLAQWYRGYPRVWVLHPLTLLTSCNRRPITSLI